MPWAGGDDTGSKLGVDVALMDPLSETRPVDPGAARLAYEIESSSVERVRPADVEGTAVAAAVVAAAYHKLTAFSREGDQGGTALN